MVDHAELMVTLEHDGNLKKVDATRVVFSPHQCFEFNNSAQDVQCLKALGDFLLGLQKLALIGSEKFCAQLLKHVPELASNLSGTVTYEAGETFNGLSSVNIGPIPQDTENAFICETLTFPRESIRQQLPASVKCFDPMILSEIAPELIPSKAWTPILLNIYPLKVPEITFRSGLDFAIVDCPSRNLSLMPNGLGYLNNALKKTQVNFQIVDLDIIAYHRFHIHRLFDMGGSIKLPGDVPLPDDPWLAEHYDVWTRTGTGNGGTSARNEVIEFFRPLIDEAVAALVEANPKALGLSIQSCNEAISREIVLGVKKLLPDIMVVVGGFSCYSPDIGRRAFPESDYMCIGEADLTIGPLMEALSRGERPFNLPGILSRFDTADYSYIPAPMIHNLDTIEFPKYEWCDLSVYRNHNDYQLTPIIASRGCRWSRCTFCAERFYWRIRTPENFVDELEWLVGQGCHLFMFNESDLGGMPERVVEICDEIIRRGLHKKAKLTGQLRVNKKQDRAFFEKLRAANFVALRFGVDAFSENTLKLQKKGYTVEMIEQNLKDCWEVGIFTEVNWVIGVPGETDKDIEEGIDLILRNAKFIGRLANINPLILATGSVYWLDPEPHKISFRGDKEELYAKYPRALPADAWYSTEPYIDASIRKQRFERIVLALHQGGFNIGAFASQVIDDVKTARDKTRVGDGTGTADVEAVSQASDSENAKKMAEPPLFKEAGQPPQLLRITDQYKILQYDGWFYAVPTALSDFTFEEGQNLELLGVLKCTSEQELTKKIEDAEVWANSRGALSDQQKQQESEPYLRADSITNKAQAAPRSRYSRIVPLGKYHIAFDEQAVADSLDKEGLGRKILSLRKNLRLERRRLRNAGMYAKSGEEGVVAKKSSIRTLLRGAYVLYFQKALLDRKNSQGSAELERSSFMLNGKPTTIVSAITKGAQPELLWTIGKYNLIKFDGVFYGMPHGYTPDWERDNLAGIPGVIISDTIKSVADRIVDLVGKEYAAESTSSSARSQTITADKPTLLATMSEHSYNLVAYEGWVYGVPHALGAVDLAEVDILEMPGVIRDVSRDAVEQEILARAPEKAA